MCWECLGSGETENKEAKVFAGDPAVTQNFKILESIPSLLCLHCPNSAIAKIACELFSSLLVSVSLYPADYALSASLLEWLSLLVLTMKTLLSS